MGEDRPESKYLSMRDFAKLVGVSHTAIAKSVDEGRLTTHEVPHHRWPMLDREEALAEWEATRVPGNNNRFGELPTDGALPLFGPEGGCDPLDVGLGSPESWAQYKVKQEALLAEEKRRLAELQRGELEGKLHRAEDVEAVWSRMMAMFRQRLLVIPGEVALQAANIEDPEQIQIFVEKLIHEALYELKSYDAHQGQIEASRRRRKG